MLAMSVRDPLGSLSDGGTTQLARFHQGLQCPIVVHHKSIICVDHAMLKWRIILDDLTNFILKEGLDNVPSVFLPT